MQIADAGPGAEPHARADRRQDHIARLLIIDAQAGNHVETAVHPRISLKQGRRLIQVINQGKNLGGIAAEVEPDGRPLPINLLGCPRFALQRSFAIAQADADGAGCFFTQDNRVGLPLIGKDLLNGLGQSFCRRAEESSSNPFGVLKIEIPNPPRTRGISL